MAYASFVRTWSQLPSGEEADDSCGMCSKVFDLGTELRRCVTCTRLACADCCPVSCVVDSVIGVRHICKGCLPAHDIAEDIPAEQMPIRLRNSSVVEMLPTRGLPLRPSSCALPANLPKGTTLMRDVMFKADKNRGDPRDPAQRKSDEHMCTSCNGSFSLVEHRHRCGACQLPVCHGCARRAVRPAHDMLNPIRICDDCVHYHTEVLPTCPLFGPIPQISPAEVERLTEDTCFDRAERRAAAFAAAAAAGCCRCGCGRGGACCGDSDCGGDEEVRTFDGDMGGAAGVNGENRADITASWASFPWGIASRIMAAIGGGNDISSARTAIATTATTPTMLSDNGHDGDSNGKVHKPCVRGHRRGGSGGQWGSDLTADMTLPSTEFRSFDFGSFRAAASSASLLTATAPPSPSVVGTPRSSPTAAMPLVISLPLLSEAGPLHVHVERIRLLKRELQREYDMAATAADNLSKEIFFEQKRVRERLLVQLAAAAVRAAAGEDVAAAEPAVVVTELANAGEEPIVAGTEPAATAANGQAAATAMTVEGDGPAAAAVAAAADGGDENVAAALAKAAHRHSPWAVTLGVTAVTAVMLATAVACSGRGSFRVCF